MSDNAPGKATSTANSTAAVSEGDQLTPTGGGLTTVEGMAFNGAVASFSDTNATTPARDFTATIDWGDGFTTAGTVSGGTGNFTVSGDHAYAEENSARLKVTLADDSPGIASATFSGTAIVADAALSATGVTFTQTEGVTFSGTTLATFTDADPNFTASDYTETIVWGDGGTTTGTVAPDGSGGFRVAGSHAYAEGGSYTPAVSIGDVGGATVTASARANVTDYALSATGTSIAGREGNSFSGPVATFTDADPDGGSAGEYTVQIDWGDGLTSGGTVTGSAGSYTISGSHTFADESSSVHVTIQDAGGSTATAATSATVADTPITASGATITAQMGTAFNGTVATFTDTNTSSTATGYSASIDWGDGFTTSGTVSGSAGHFTVNGSHTYSQEGRYALSVTVIDVQGATVTGSGLAHVARVGPPPTALPVVANALTHSAEYYQNLITPIYQAYLGRTPDAGGLAFWIGQMQNGLSDEHLEAGFIGSPEYYRHAGGTDKLWVDAMYANLLGRAPDSGGESFWVQQLAAGTTRSAVAYGFAASTEREGERIAADYLRYLGRPLDPQGQAFWVDLFENHGASNENVVASFVASQEYFLKHFDNIGDWLYDAYKDILGRPPDAGGLQGWLAFLKS